jgi:hypothetical protein
MAGLSKRFCRQACSGEPPARDSEDRGLCGLCSGGKEGCTPCDEAYGSENCGDWQNCDCADACGDGHNCDRYIDIEFTLDSFVIQGKVCTNASTVELTQQCGGGGAVDMGGDFDLTPVTGNPSGWSTKSNGESGFVTYEKTVHRLRLTRQDCGCFWGGYWSSSCDCNTCCCTGDDECDEGSIYPNCDGEGCGNHACLDGIAQCFDESGASDFNCRACDPSNPCYPTDDGYASSLDTYGTGEVGGSDGEALCLAQSGASGTDACGYRQNTCDDWIDDGTPAFAGWEVGDFKPHHIEAYFTYKVDSLDNCNSGWVLEIRGLTELSRSEMGLAGSYPSLDCFGGGGCQQSYGGGAEAALGYRGRWWGLHSCLGQEDYCVCNLACSQNNCEGDDFDYPRCLTPAVPELAFHSCSCPPAVEIESSVRVDGALQAFHPASIFASNQDNANSGSMYTCVVNDAQGNNAPDQYCNNDTWVAVMNPPCLGKEYMGDGNYSEGTCYGSPAVWWGECNHCTDCCKTEPTGCSVPCDCGRTSDDCQCSFPNVVISDEGIPNPAYPCSHCGAGGDPSLNHYSCNPCPAGNLESHQCAPCSIKIRPNSNDKPWWAGET